MVAYQLIANYFIVRAYEDGIESDLTNLKIQKLLYYAQSLHLALYDELLFEEEIQAWRYGPVCPAAYRYYSEFEAKQLPIPEKTSLASLSEKIQAVLEEVWEYFGGYHAYRLSGMTHSEFPWQKAWQQLPATARSEALILLQDLKALGLQKLEWIEREHPFYQPTLSKLIGEVQLTGTSRHFHKERSVIGSTHFSLKSSANFERFFENWRKFMVKILCPISAIRVLRPILEKF